MIEVNGLTKAYGATRVVQDVSFACAPGTVTGFVGPNGAGKSTTLRMLCGLTPSDAGTATIAGRPYHALPEPATTVGVLLDASAFHPGRNGTDTLRRAAELSDVPRARVQEVLDRVGLAGKPGSRRVGDYSLGMRQRLGIGLALIAEPSVLVLDEPANGLDPEGIAWMRRLLREFADRGGTVLLSSHLLSEVEATVDRLVVIGDGRIVAAGSLSELLGGGATRVRAADADALAVALEREDIAFTRLADGALSAQAPPERVSEAALEARIVLSELRGEGLEQMFFALTGDSSRNPIQTEEVVA